MNKQEITALVIDKINFARNKTNADIPMPKVSFDVKGVVAGYAKYREWEVSFNMDLAKENPDDFHHTVIHEVSHLVTKVLFPRAKQAHGPEFKKVDKWLGGKGTRCHTYDVKNHKREIKKTKYVTICGCIDSPLLTEKQLSELESGKISFWCKACSQVLAPTGEEVLWSNINGILK